MGLFSWITQDTKESIPCKGNEVRDLFTVIMRDDKGNTWIEPYYQGYGIFNGKDYFVLMAEMNNIVGEDEDDTREKGISLFFNKYPEEIENVKFPNLNRFLATKWKNESPKLCPDQGFFYDDDEW